MTTFIFHRWLKISIVQRNDCFLSLSLIFKELPESSHPWLILENLRDHIKITDVHLNEMKLLRNIPSIVSTRSLEWHQLSLIFDPCIYRRVSLPLDYLYFQELCESWDRIKRSALSFISILTPTQDQKLLPLHLNSKSHSLLIWFWSFLHPSGSV